MSPAVDRRLAVVLLSGGLDSATVLACATQAGYACHTLAIDYGQKHRVELQAAEHISQVLGGVKHHVIQVDLRVIGGSALTAELDVPECPTQGIPITYVPARNTILLSLALGLAEVVGANDLFIGVNAVDYSGYPDCRPAFVAAFQRLARVATKAAVEGAAMTVHTPLIDLSKAEIIRRGSALGVDYGQTISCYQADRRGRACGRCESCHYRRRGFLAAGIADPTRYVDDQVASD